MSLKSFDPSILAAHENASVPAAFVNMESQDEKLESKYWPIPNAYIVMLKKDHDREMGINHFDWLLEVLIRVKSNPITITRIFHGSSHGYAFQSHDGGNFKQVLEGLEEVATVEQDYWISLPGGEEFDFGSYIDEVNKLRESDHAVLRQFIGNDKQIKYDAPERSEFTSLDDDKKVQSNAPWGISRLSRKDSVPDEKSAHNYTYPANAGVKARIYVVDTGIMHKHPEFGGRAIRGPTFTSDGNEDVFGHGSHVAGIAAGNTYGVAKQATVIGVKALNNRGSGTISGIIQALQYVKTDAAPILKKVPVIVNLSLGGPKNVALNSACEDLVKAGVVVVVAAGNSRRSACTFSPASAQGVISVVASCGKDDMASFSNHGECTHIVAPGCRIPSIDVRAKDPTKPVLQSGTSMSAPHVSGLAAVFGTTFSTGNNQYIKDFIFGYAHRGHVTGLPANTPNRLSSLYGLVRHGDLEDEIAMLN